MKETDFISQNKKKWQEFEHMLATENKDPNKLTDLYVQITDDLSYARTFYPNRSVRFYLNNLAQQLFYDVNKQRRNSLKNFMNFWSFQVPRVVYESRKELMLSLAIFVIAMAIGVFSSVQDPDFPKVILGESYVAMTMENIQSGDPMAVYKKSGQFDMFLGITMNNLLVAFRTFVTGLLLAVGTVLIMLYNGIMVGAFQYFFIEKGLFLESFLTIWLHGTLEISAIIIAGGAGLKLGSGLIFPGTYSRLQAFKLSGRKGLIIMMSLVPVFVLAALIEGFITRYTEMPNLLRGGLILASLLFIVGYYALLPLLKARRGDFQNLSEEKLTPSYDPEIDLKAINSPGQIFSNNFVFYKKAFTKIGFFALLASVLCTIPVTFVLNKVIGLNELESSIFFVANLFNYDHSYGTYLAIVNCLMLGSTIMFTLHLINKNHFNGAYRKKLLSVLLPVAVLAVLVQIALHFHPFFMVLSVVLVLPVLFMWCQLVFFEDGNPFTQLSRTMDLSFSGYGKLLTLLLILLATSTIYFLLIESPLTYVFFEAINMNLEIEPEQRKILYIIFSVFISFLGLNLIIPLYVFGFMQSFFSNRETMDAVHLKERINSFGLSKKQ
ncbi:MAG: stage II sporulation protein M [Cytophagaceae bacterium]